MAASGTGRREQGLRYGGDDPVTSDSASARNVGTSRRLERRGKVLPACVLKRRSLSTRYSDRSLGSRHGTPMLENTDYP